MLDTKLKKTHRIACFIIALTVLLPALGLTALYPRMEKEYLKKLTELKGQENVQRYEEEWYISDNFVNYAVEALYFLYGDLLIESQEKTVDFDVLYEYDWESDFSEVESNVQYYVVDANGKVRTNGSEELATLLDAPTEEYKNTLKEDGGVAYMTISFDAEGNIGDLKFYGLRDIPIRFPSNPYRDVKDSIVQYENNVKFYNQSYEDSKIDAKQLLPKDLKAVFVLPESASIFMWNNYYENMYISPKTIYVENGVHLIILFLAGLVALVALLLPFVSALETGWEKLFSLPMEMNGILAFMGFGGAVMMFSMMCETPQIFQHLSQNRGEFEILGVALSTDMIYGAILACNFLGWAACFFLEYIVVAHARQFLSRPKYYIQNRLLIVSMFRWCVNKTRELYDWVTSIDIASNLNRSILKIVGVNFVILSLISFMWFFGIAALILYSIGLYVLLRKYGEKIQRQYLSVLQATEEMADGNLRITLDEDLGVFTPIGNGLERVQEGFSKAVKEEAKSQNMKTELITNVSHDLKTPLTAIITYVDLLKQPEITEEDRKSYIDVLDQKSRRLKALIEDLFEVSKANSGNIKMHFMDVDVVNLMKQVRLEMEDKLEESGLSFRWNLPETHVMLSLDGQRTYRVFENLLNNIVKYSLPNSRVYVDIQETESEVKIMFRNISAVELDGNTEKLTERFVRGDVARNSEGSGLGLAIVKSFVELQHGNFDIEVDGDLFKAIIIWKK